MVMVTDDLDNVGFKMGSFDLVDTKVKGSARISKFFFFIRKVNILFRLLIFLAGLI